MIQKLKAERKFFFSSITKGKSEWIFSGYSSVLNSSESKIIGST